MPNIPSNSVLYVTEVVDNPFENVSDGLTNIIRFSGGPSTPRNVKRQRANNLNAMRRYGTPIIVKHMYNDQDVQDGIAEDSPNFSSIYGQTRHDDPLSHGIGLVSVEKSDKEWISTEGEIVYAPGPGRVPAPKYRGYGPGYLTYAILPDVSQDIFKLTETGVLIKTQTATAQMGWFPEMNDNDLLIIAEIDNQERVINTRERFLLKMTSPAAMRGLDRNGRREFTEDFGNRHVTDQTFEMTLIPDNDVKMNVEVDR